MRNRFQLWTTFGNKLIMNIKINQFIAYAHVSDPFYFILCFFPSLIKMLIYSIAVIFRITTPKYLSSTTSVSTMTLISVSKLIKTIHLVKNIEFVDILTYLMPQQFSLPVYRILTTSLKEKNTKTLLPLTSRETTIYFK